MTKSSLAERPFSQAKNKKSPAKQGQTPKLVTARGFSDSRLLWTLLQVFMRADGADNKVLRLRLLWEASKDYCVLMVFTRKKQKKLGIFNNTNSSSIGLGSLGLWDLQKLQFYRTKNIGNHRKPMVFPLKISVFLLLFIFWWQRCEWD